MKTRMRIALVLTLAAATGVGLSACAEEEHGGKATVDSLLADSARLRGRFEEMADPGYWGRPGSEETHATRLSDDLARVAGSMHGVLSRLGPAADGTGDEDLRPRMLDHLHALNGQLDAMAGILSHLRGGDATHADMGPMGSMDGSGGMGPGGSMMERMGRMRSDFQSMADRAYWMHGGGMMSGAGPMMAMCGDLAAMSGAMVDAMGEMRSMAGSDRSDGREPLGAMREHMNAMAGLLGDMRHDVDRVAPASQG